MPEVDFKTAIGAQLSALPDENVLAIASAEKRILVTHDRRTMPHHFADFIQNQECWGVIIVSRKLEIRRVIEEIILIWDASDAEECLNSVRYMPIGER